jgi:hypothetical protein
MIDNLILFKKLQKDREESYKTLQKPSMKGVNTSVIDKYSEPAHFILELLQNADDVEAEKINIELQDDRLIFEHNGKRRFEITDVDNEDEDSKNGLLGHINSITSIGNTQKKGNTIGKFGVGFKSVFQYCDEPEIYDHPISFKISNLIVPIGLEENYNQRDKTKFVLKFKNELDLKVVRYDIINKLFNLSDNIIFLRNIKYIEWKAGSDSGLFLKEIKNNETYNSITILCETIRNNEQENKDFKFLEFFQNVSNHTNHKISVVYRIHDDKLSYDKSNYPYCFFPLIGEQKNFKFIIHAPFLLTDNREKINLSKEKEWNESLIKELASLFSKSLIVLRDLKLLLHDSFNVLPITEIQKDSFYYPIYESFIKTLKNGEELIPSNNEGIYLKVENSFIARPAEICSIFYDIKKSLKTDKAQPGWVDSKITQEGSSTKDIWNFFNKILGIRIIRPETIRKIYFDEYLNEEKDEYLIKLYAFFKKYDDFKNIDYSFMTPPQKQNFLNISKFREITI